MVVAYPVFHDGDTVPLFARCCEGLIANTEIQRKIRAPLPVILYVKCDHFLLESTVRGTARHGDCKSIQWPVGNHISESCPVEVAGIATATKIVEPVCFDIATKLQGVIPRRINKALRELPQILPVSE